jgi:hypothetical protein
MQRRVGVRCKIVISSHLRQNLKSRVLAFHMGIRDARTRRKAQLHYCLSSLLRGRAWHKVRIRQTARYHVKEGSGVYSYSRQNLDATTTPCSAWQTLRDKPCIGCCRRGEHRNLREEWRGLNKTKTNKNGNQNWWGKNLPTFCVELSLSPKINGEKSPNATGVVPEVIVWNTHRRRWKHVILREEGDASNRMEEEETHVSRVGRREKNKHVSELKCGVLSPLSRVGI